MNANQTQRFPTATLTFQRLAQTSKANTDMTPETDHHEMTTTEAASYALALSGRERKFHAYQNKDGSSHLLLVDEDGGGIFADAINWPSEAEWMAFTLNSALGAARRADVEALRARAEKAEADLAKARGELAAMRAEKPKTDLQRAILAMLRVQETVWPAGDVPSSRLWAALVARGAVATVRPGQAADGEAHRFYKAKMALIRDGLITEARGFVRLGDLPPTETSTTARELEPTFLD